MFYLIKQLSIHKALKVRSVFIASTAATLKSVQSIAEVELMIRQYSKSLDLFKFNVADFLTIMSSEDRARFEKVLPLYQKIYDSYKETVLPRLYKDSVEFNCISSYDVYTQLKRLIPRMLNGKAVAINRPTFSLCSDLGHDDIALMLVYKSKDCTKRISFAFNIAERQFDVQSYPAELDTTEDGRVVIPGKTALADICDMLQMPIWLSNEYITKNYMDNEPFYMNHDLLTRNLPDSILDLPVTNYFKTFTFANLHCLSMEIYNRQQAMN